jgi:small multidrug resistance family-3 protein
MATLGTFLIYLLAGVAEIAGCYSVWAWLRLGQSPLWLVPGAISLAAFAFLLTRIDTGFAGRAYAAYAGVYLLASLGWLWVIEGKQPDRWDLIGGAVALVGAAIILFGPRPSPA